MGQQQQRQQQQQTLVVAGAPRPHGSGAISKDLRQSPTALQAAAPLSKQPPPQQ